MKDIHLKILFQYPDCGYTLKSGQPQEASQKLSEIYVISVAFLFLEIPSGRNLAQLVARAPVLRHDVAEAFIAGKNFFSMILALL